VTARDEGFERHAREQRERWLALTPEQRLQWLERAKRFARLALAASAASHAPRIDTTGRTDNR